MPKKIDYRRSPKKPTQKELADLRTKIYRFSSQTELAKLKYFRDKNIRLKNIHAALTGRNNKLFYIIKDYVDYYFKGN